MDFNRETDKPMFKKRNKEFVIKSPSKWIGITEDNIEIKSRKDLRESFEEIKNRI